MSPPKFIKVIGYSSEDGQFPAENLTTSKGKWRCKEEGEKQAWVILQINSLIHISHVDIGNLGSAFIEVQVGRVGMDQDKFSVLLPSSSFMGPEESRSGMNETRVRMFSSDKLNQNALKEKWNLVKVICSQPFNKRTKYGISFIVLSGVEETVVKTPEKTSDSPPVKLGAFKLKDDAEDDLSVGSYFQHRKDAKPSASAELRSDRTLASLALQTSAKEEQRFKELQAQFQSQVDKRKDHRQDTVLPRRDQLPGEHSHIPDKHDKQDKKDKHERHKKEKHDKEDRSRDKHEGKERSKDNQSRDKDSRKESKERHHKDAKNGHKDKDKDKDRSRSQDKDRGPTGERKESGSKRKPEANGKHESSASKKAVKYAPFDELMKGVTFVMSGFQNPLRGDIRSKACKMGAKYKPDWDRTCTHLICAFVNTPKFREVKGKGKIVKKDWIEESYDSRKKLNWKKYSLTKSSDEVSDEEVHEGDPQLNQNESQGDNQHSAAASLPHSSRKDKQETPDPEEEDTDDEIERVMKANKVFSKEEDENKDYHLDEDTDDELRQAQDRIQQQQTKKHKKGKLDSVDNSSDEEGSNGGESRKRKKKSPHKQDKRNKRKRSEEDSAYEVDTDAENSDDAYSAQTDVEDDNIEEMKKRLSDLPLKKFPQIFKGKEFLLKGLGEEEQKLLERYVVCYGGNISMYNSPSVGFILTKTASSNDIRDAKSVNSDVKVLHPDWVFRCCDKQSLTDTSKYKL